jgi:hypothetical protein
VCVALRQHLLVVVVLLFRHTEQLLVKGCSRCFPFLLPLPPTNFNPTLLSLA